MAHPIYSFIYAPNKKRYYQIWDTVKDYPVTIPVDLITFLQLKGLYNKEYVGTLFSKFHHLINHGTTIPGVVFPNPNMLEDPFFVQAIDFLNECNEVPDKPHSILNSQLEELFLLDIQFSEFYARYLDLISTINEHPNRQLNYYHSYAHTAKCLEKSDTLIHFYVKQIFDDFGISELLINNGNLFHFDNWFKTGLFFTHQPAMAALFCQFGKNNLVAIDAIPHVLRKNKEVKKLFRYFGMQNLLPETVIIKKNKRRIFQIKKFEINPFLREYANHAAFHYLGDRSLIGLPIINVTNDEINKRLSNCFMETSSLINFEDQYGQTLLPMLYSSYFAIDTKSNIHILAPLNLQQHHVFTKNGRIIDETGYWDYYKLTNSIFYFQHLDFSNWQRIAFNSDENLVCSDKINDKIDYQNMDVTIKNIELNFVKKSEEAHEIINERYEKNLIDNIQNVLNDDNSDEDDLPF